jgi:type I restriction enzyme S subunit
MVKENTMKQTEIGLFPEDWTVYKIEDLTPKNIKYTIVDGPFGSNLKTIHYRKKGIPIITSGYVTGGKFYAEEYLYVDKEKFQQEKRSSVQAGDIIMAKIGERCGASAILPLNHIESILSGNALKIKINKEKFSSDLIAQILYNDYLRGNLNQLRTVGAQPAISMANLKVYKIPLPALPEQEAIAEALSDADVWMESLEKLIAKKCLIKQGAMQELLKPKEDWEVKKLGEVCEIIMGQSPLSEFYNNSGIGLPLVQGNADIENRKTIVRNYTSQITKRGKIGDIIMSVRAPVGEIATATFDCCLGRGVCAFRTESKFLYHLLIYKEDDWGQFSTGSTFDSVNSNQIRDLEINIPKSLTEQSRVEKILSDMDAELESLATQLAKARQVKQGMMQELLTGRTRLT